MNLKGRFNVPLGLKTEVRFEQGFLEGLSEHLQNVTLVAGDFESLIDDAKKGDFLFVDPPYTVTHNNNGFIKYNNVLFSWDDQMRLAVAVKRARKRGVLVLVSNANHPEVADLYDGFRKAILKRTSILSGDPSYRKRTSEAAFLNY